jgi:hypothetical protein
MVPMTAKNLSLEWAPSACTLPTAAQPLRLAEFDDLFATTLRQVEHATATRARFTLVETGQVRPTVENLTVRESSCCSFFTFTISSAGPYWLFLDIEVPAAHVDVLTALVARASGSMAAMGSTS